MRHRSTKLAHLAVVAAAVLMLGACSVRDTIAGPTCDGERSSGLIEAQSVPSATLVPCFEALPAGWEISTVEINQNGTRVILDSDRAGGSAAEMRFVASCDVGAAVSTPTDRAPARRFDAIEQVAPAFRATRYYLFDGGCVRWRFDFDRDVPSALSIELDDAVVLFDRQVLNDNVRETFVDADL